MNLYYSDSDNHLSIVALTTSVSFRTFLARIEKVVKICETRSGVTKIPFVRTYNAFNLFRIVITPRVNIENGANSNDFSDFAYHTTKLRFPAKEPARNISWKSIQALCRYHSQTQTHYTRTTEQFFVAPMYEVKTRFACSSSQDFCNFGSKYSKKCIHSSKIYKIMVESPIWSFFSSVVLKLDLV